MEKNTTKNQKNYFEVLSKLPSWLISALITVPIVALLGVVFYVLSTGQINFLFWIILPSILFEQLFETSFYAFSNSQLANLIFVLLFWSSIGALVGWITAMIRRQSSTK
ncbi:MAG: hypothetical protein QNK30_06135 [Bacteroidales bacterium]|nr:hypothetical protein [Bacteroidales bacterium]